MNFFHIRFFSYIIGRHSFLGNSLFFVVSIMMPKYDTALKIMILYLLSIMFYYIQSNDANSWNLAEDSQIQTLQQCIGSESDVKFSIADPVSGKLFYSVCKLRL